MTEERKKCDLWGKTAVVTGGGGAIGRAIVIELARAGADVLVHTGFRQEAAQSVADQVHEIERETKVIVANLTSCQLQDQFFQQAWAWRDGVDVWINVAGVDVLTGEVASLSFDEKLHRLWQVDVMATVRLSRMAGQKMQQRSAPPGSSVIINMGWDQAQHGMAGDSGEMFAVVKGGVMAFTRSLAKSLAPEVRVNGLAPGWIKTAWGEKASDYWQQRAVDESLLGRWGSPQDVARVARFIASPAAAFVSGQIIEVNGGLRTEH